MICYHRHVAQEFRLSPLASYIEKNYTLKCFNCSTNSYSFEESIRALHSTPSVKEEEKEHMHAHLGDVCTTSSFLPHSCYICLIRAISTSVFHSFQTRKTES